MPAVDIKGSPHIANKVCNVLFVSGTFYKISKALCLAGLLSLGDIPRCPPPPLIVNLDVTSMCALVSEVSHGGPTNSAVCEWAQRISHWEECLQVL